MQYQVFESVAITPLKRVVAAQKTRFAKGHIMGGLAFPSKIPAHLRYQVEGDVSDLDVDEFSKTPKVLGGAYIWGGHLGPHFGHILTEYVHRLWLVDEKVTKDWPVLFILSAHNPSVEKLVTQILALFRIKNCCFVYEDTVVEKLAIGEMGRQFKTQAKPAYINWLQQRVPLRSLQQEGYPKKLCVLRSHLFSGRLVLEKDVENVLEANGYTVFRPEAHSLIEQVRHYANAEKIVFSEGSAIHMLDVMPPIPATVALLQRRPIGKIADYCIIDKVQECHVLASCVRVAHPVLEKQDTNNALSFIPFGEVLDFLISSGFLPKGARPSFEPDYLADIASYYSHHRKVEAGAFSPNRLARALMKEMRVSFDIRRSANYQQFVSKSQLALLQGDYDLAHEYAVHACRVFRKDLFAQALLIKAKRMKERGARFSGRLLNSVERALLFFTARKNITVDPPTPENQVAYSVRKTETKHDEYSVK